MKCKLLQEPGNLATKAEVKDSSISLSSNQDTQLDVTSYPDNEIVSINSFHGIHGNSSAATTRDPS